MFAEPMTMLTDYLLAVLAVWLGARLWRHSAEIRARTLLAASFCSIGFAALVGGTLHGFRPVLGDQAYALLWKFSVLAIGVTAFLFLASSAYASLRAGPRRGLLTMAIILLVVYVAWMVQHDEFIWVIVNYVPQVIVVLGLQVVQVYRGVAGAGWLVGGLLVTLAAAMIQVSGFAPHRHFNHNDLYHVVQMAGIVLLFRGGWLIGDYDG